MNIRVNGTEIPGCLAARRGPTNFGQPFPEPNMAFRYQIALRPEEFVKQIEGIYAQAVQEEVADAPHHPAGDWPVLDQLQALGYPPLQALLHQAPEIVKDLVKEWLPAEVLDRLIPGPEEGVPKFLMNTLDNVRISLDAILIEGQAYLHPQFANESSSLDAVSVRPA